MTDLITQYRADAARIKTRRDKIKAELDEAVAKNDEIAACGLRMRIRNLDELHYNLMQSVEQMSK
ncbi:MAG: hypothetical protein IJ424_08015 [Oscillospiraceae bacterium]|nr:hypothetical protein [Oscillospiraceae bacterium]